MFLKSKNKASMLIHKNNLFLFIKIIKVIGNFVKKQPKSQSSEKSRLN